MSVKILVVSHKKIKIKEINDIKIEKYDLIFLFQSEQFIKKKGKKKETQFTKNKDFDGE